MGFLPFSIFAWIRVKWRLRRNFFVDNKKININGLVVDK
jgi:hypothetical protein